MLRSQTVPNIIELPGRIESVRMAEVRARTDGIVLRRLYEEGATVAAGTALFKIDPRDYEAQVASARAALQRAIAAKENASSIVIRYGPLIDERAVSAQEYDAAESDLRQANAQVAEARAALDRAQLQLSYTTVRAPIGGRVGAAEVTEGALVSGAEGTLMTRVDQASPVYAVFSASNASVLNTLSAVREGQLKVPALDSVEVRLELENGEEYGVIGHLDFASPVVSPETGSQTIRGQFANPAGLLVPGQFVRGKIALGMIEGGITVPSRAVQFKGEEAQVSVMGKDGTVTSRTVRLGEMVGSSWIVESGLKPGERIITDGWQKIRPGQKAIDAEQAKRAAAQQQKQQQGR
ncbi:efflux RND transporter periplasmic adaptor subunit [Novosphingobium sp. PC22D]|uniref:efflux RND transporter periplasmic adaptor subunit n=1 Tax=Novosphingobium sp. PC22D TaxID=1962403 RepID=UPI001F0A9584|nr:efflux RND transporter periplasmic adaptor subunit [Novosphingobium sp. PC22D]